MTYTVELKNEHALQLLQQLEQLGVLTIHNQGEAPMERRPLSFKALSYSTKGFKFNRDEANEREGLL